MNQSHNEKPPVLLVHGMWGNQEALKEVHDTIVEQAYVTESLRLPYHCPKAEHTAASKEKLAQTALQDYVVYIIEQVKRQNSPPILIGHSMGGLLVQLVAAQVPCNRLILLSSAAPAGVNGLSLSAIKTFAATSCVFRCGAASLKLNWQVFATGLLTRKAQRCSGKFMPEAPMNRVGRPGKSGMGLLLGRRSAAYVNTEQIQCPVLIIGGTADRITPINVQRSIAQGFGARGQLVEIPNCCHWTVGGKFFLQIRTEIFQWLNT